MPKSDNALDLLREDHQQVMNLLTKLQDSRDEDEQQDLREEVVSALEVHTEMEEQVFYPFFVDATGRQDQFEEAAIEHDLVKYLMEQWTAEAVGTERMQAMTRVLAELVRHHVEEEEEELFPQLEQTGADLDALGTALEECRSNLEGERPDMDSETSAGR